MAYTLWMLLFALVAEAWVVARSVRDVRVPAWQAAVAPLAWFVGLRHQLAGFAPDTSVEAVISTYQRLGVGASGLVLLGLASVAGGVVPWLRAMPEERGEAGSPALAEIGVISMVAGVVGVAWIQGHIELWTALGNGAAAVEDVAGMVRARMRAVGWVAVAALAVGWPVVGAWGYRRERWRGLREGVAAAVLLAMTLSTGQAARRSLASVSEAQRLCRTEVSPVPWWMPDHPATRGRTCSVDASSHQQTDPR